jgi:uncharacterized protein YqeY
MALKKEIEAQMREALKAKDSARLGCVRLMLAAIKNREIEKRGELDDAEILKVLSTLAKQRSESIELYRQGGRADLVAKESAELAVIQSFLPKALSDAELERIIADAISESGAKGPKEMGMVMKALGPKVAGRADGRKVSEAVKAALAKL